MFPISGKDMVLGIALVVGEAPVADTERYDALRTGEASHA
jgi:hypothetical protein